MLPVQDLFLWLQKTWLPWASFLLQMVTHFHASSYIKLRRVKMCMQMRSGRKEHKATDVVTLCVFCSCIGHELIRREAAVSLKRGKRRELTNTKRRCWLVIAGCCSQETRWQLYPVHDFIFRGNDLFPKNVISELKKYSKLECMITEHLNFGD